MKRMMRLLWVVCISHLYLLPVLSGHAEDKGDIPLDLQVDLQIPERKDMQALKKLSSRADKKSSEESVFDGIWSAKQMSQTCPAITGNFKVQIAGETIRAVSGRVPIGFITLKGHFELDMIKADWTIKFVGDLQQKTGRADWIQTRGGKESCQGVVTFQREGNDTHQ